MWVLAFLLLGCFAVCGYMLTRHKGAFAIAALVLFVVAFIFLLVGGGLVHVD